MVEVIDCCDNIIKKNIDESDVQVVEVNSV
jgi:hypothetical protein